MLMVNIVQNKYKFLRINYICIHLYSEYYSA